MFRAVQEGGPFFEREGMIGMKGMREMREMREMKGGKISLGIGVGASYIRDCCKKQRPPLTSPY